jgi:threonine/homoserine/homoserine lactone efflux protein
MIINYFYGWLSLLSISMLASMVPGISFALVLRNTICASRTAGIWTSVGLAIGMLVYVSAILLGLAFLKNENLYHIIRWGGAFYLAYVGIGCLQSKSMNLQENTLPQHRKTIPPTSALRMGFLTNLLNPKVMLFFLALFTQFLHPNMPVSIGWIYGFTVAFVELCWFSLVSIILTHPVLYHRFQMYSHWIERASGITLLLISSHLMIHELSHLV